MCAPWGESLLPSSSPPPERPAWPLCPRRVQKEAGSSGVSRFRRSQRQRRQLCAASFEHPSAGTMTIFCSHCHRPLQAEMSCLPRRGKQAPAASKPFRSTKSASKARRDQINVELQALRSLLPISAREKERLSYLHTMALVCLQLRGAQMFPPDSAPPAGPALGTELLSLLPGFLLVLLANGKLVYISENVAQVLGLSVVELLAQGDTVFDILDGQACEDVQKKLLLAQEEPGREVTFVSEMRTSKTFRLQYGGNRAVAVCGRFTALRWSASATAFLALCTPVMRLHADSTASSQDNLFQSTHVLDMTFTDVTESVTYHLGYYKEELIGQSWYSLLHPEDTDLAAAQHRAVVLGAGTASGMAVLRVLRRDRTWAWLRVSARRDGGGHVITCTSHCLREEEAAYLRAREHRPTPRNTAAPPPTPVAAPPPGRELSLLAAQLRALADSLSPPAAAPAWPEAEAFPPGPHDTALTRLLGDALEGAGAPVAHAQYVPCPHQ
ncbi:neuronal PAS domain-containing protein 4-like [Grus americana]|uniref:neuronal PAS domain-containing protein 4-like n=1 Tax=Grus americana TaxID=9117 RepID=UPI002407DDD5|nr:neuronal PAS domain-containing protein 4-like [Grus americana]